jgi:hypothetical protein
MTGTNTCPPHPHLAFVVRPQLGEVGVHAMHVLSGTAGRKIHLPLQHANLWGGRLEQRDNRGPVLKLHSAHAHFGQAYRGTHHTLMLASAAARDRPRFSS